VGEEGAGVLVHTVAVRAGGEDPRVMPCEDVVAKRVVLLERLVGTAEERVLKRVGVRQLAALP
jgi:hypothetical protein